MIIRLPTFGNFIGNLVQLSIPNSYYLFIITNIDMKSKLGFNHQKGYRSDSLSYFVSRRIWLHFCSKNTIWMIEYYKIIITSERSESVKFHGYSSEFHCHSNTEWNECVLGSGQVGTYRCTTVWTFRVLGALDSSLADSYFLSVATSSTVDHRWIWSVNL